MAWRPETAMVLGAGYGKRMRPLTDRMPKPLVPVAGRPLIDHVLDRLVDLGVTRTVVNVHYLADQLEQHLATRRQPQIIMSDERGRLLDTGGGIVKALPALAADTFLVHNSDSIWLEGSQSNLARLAEAFDDDRMDCMMLLAPTATSLGYAGCGDFDLQADGSVSRRADTASAEYVFAGVSIMRTSLLYGRAPLPFSLNVPWDDAIAAGRLYGMPLEGTWMHIGTLDALKQAEEYFDRAAQ